MPGGSEQPILFTSRTLSAAEKGYTQFETEALALISGVRKFRKYLIGRKCTLVADHRPLVKILGPKGRHTQVRELFQWLLSTSHKSERHHHPSVDVHSPCADGFAGVGLLFVESFLAGDDELRRHSLALFCSFRNLDFSVALLTDKMRSQKVCKKLHIYQCVAFETGDAPVPMSYLTSASGNV